MEFHGIDMQGKYKAQLVADASALVWDPDDERRIVYDETEGTLWIANSSEWTTTSFEPGTAVWFYQDAAPIGWTIATSLGDDELIGVKGDGTGSNVYNTGGASYGVWATPTHYHSLNAHTHLVSGNTGNNPDPGTDHGDDDHDAANRIHAHPVSITSQGPNTPNTATDGSSSAYRPLARVGVICDKDT
jgi:hypothetical protein